MESCFDIISLWACRIRVKGTWIAIQRVLEINPILKNPFGKQLARVYPKNCDDSRKTQKYNLATNVRVIAYRTRLWWKRTRIWRKFETLQLHLNVAKMIWDCGIYSRSGIKNLQENFRHRHGTKSRYNFFGQFCFRWLRNNRLTSRR